MRVSSASLLKPTLTAWLVLFSVQVSFADQQGFYFGSSIGIEDIESKYTKSVVEAVEQEVAELGEDVNARKSESQAKPYSLGGLLGYRMDLNENRMFVAIQTEVMLRGNKVGGVLKKAGETTNTHRLAADLTEDWSLDTESDVGLILKFGSMYSMFGFIDVSAYALAGVRQAKLEFRAEIPGCDSMEDCAQEDLLPRFQRKNPTLNLFTIGAGIEKTIGDKTSMQIELRYTGQSKEGWSYEDDEVRIPSSIENTSYDLSARLVKYL